MMNPDGVREKVSEAYADALDRRRSSGGGCCCSSEGATESAARPGLAEAESASFGCGSPLPFADVEPGQTVLDLGAGAGLDLLVAAEKVGPKGRVIGVDMTDAMIQAARENIERAGATNVEVRRGIIENLPVEDGSVDWVISNCVINLSPEKERVFSEIHRVLRPGGRFSISDMVAEELPDWVLQGAAAYVSCVAGAVSEDRYLEGLRTAGLRDVQVVARQVYEAAQIRGLVDQDLSSELPKELFERALAEVDGKVASIRVTGRR